MPDIRIEVDAETGDFTYIPSVCHVSPNGRISWVANGDWAVMFTDRTPLNTAEIRGRAGKLSPPARVSRDAAKGPYHYAVAVAVGNRVFLDAGCPTIVIG